MPGAEGSTPQSRAAYELTHPQVPYPNSAALTDPSFPQSRLQRVSFRPSSLQTLHSQSGRYSAIIFINISVTLPATNSTMTDI